jgi:hypothetical protein
MKNIFQRYQDDIDAGSVKTSYIDFNTKTFGDMDTIPTDSTQANSEILQEEISNLISNIKVSQTFDIGAFYEDERIDPIETMVAKPETVSPSKLFDIRKTAKCLNDFTTLFKYENAKDAIRCTANVCHCKRTELIKSLESISTLADDIHDMFISGSSCKAAKLPQEALRKIKLFIRNSSIPSDYMQQNTIDFQAKVKKEAFQKLVKRPFFNETEHEVKSYFESADKSIFEAINPKHEDFAKLPKKEVFDPDRQTWDFESVGKIFMPKGKTAQLTKLESYLRIHDYNMKDFLFNNLNIKQIVEKRISFIYEKYNKETGLKGFNLQKMITLDVFKLLFAIEELREHMSGGESRTDAFTNATFENEFDLKTDHVSSPSYCAKTYVDVEENASYLGRKMNTEDDIFNSVFSIFPEALELREEDYYLRDNDCVRENEFLLEMGDLIYQETQPVVVTKKVENLKEELFKIVKKPKNC